MVAHPLSPGRAGRPYMLPSTGGRRAPLPPPTRRRRRRQSDGGGGAWRLSRSGSREQRSAGAAPEDCRARTVWGEDSGELGGRRSSIVSFRRQPCNFLGNYSGQRRKKPSHRTTAELIAEPPVRDAPMMDGRGSQRSNSSPGSRGVHRNRSNEWRQRQYDSSSDNDELGPEGAGPPASIVLQPAKSGDLTSRDLAGYPGSFGGGRSGSTFSSELAGRDRADQLHYASKPVSSGIYQSLGRKGEARPQSTARSARLHTPPEPAPPEVPSRGPSSHQAVRSLQRLQAGYPSDGDVNLPSPSEYRLPGSPRSHMGPSPLRGYNPSEPDTYASLNGAQTRLVMDGGQKGGSSEPVMPLVMPVYPAQRTNLCHHVAPPAYSPERNQLKDECRYRCSWRLATACLAVLSVLLLALMAYFAVDVSDTAADTPSRASLPVSPRTPPPVPAPSRLTPGAAVVHQLAPHELWTVEHDVNRPQVMNLTVTAPLSASLAVYGRRNAAPRVTQHEFGAFVRAGALERSARVLSRRTGRSPFGDELLENVTLIEHLEPGRWFVAVLNDGEATVPVQLAVQTGEPDTLRCPVQLLGPRQLPPWRVYVQTWLHRTRLRHKECILLAYPLSHGVCPVLCSNHGSYSGGRCHCVDGWKGAECDLPATDCVIADCHRHGVCRLGRCECAPGWKGEFCQTADCADPTCSGHGVCTEGVCVCLAGWVGSACQQPDERIRRCLPDCSGHGVFDLSRDRCLCDEMWTGPECAKPRCNLDCGPHGSCQAGDCVCDPGWNGQLCDLRTCDPRCSEHGQCKNGTCVCLQGWNGQHCSIPGCPGGCSGRGSCVKTDGWYGCVCATGWDGVNCSIPLEMDCRDGIDNDGDGMKDCSDSECCWDSNCQNSLMCLISPEPVDVLLRKQPARQTASFYQRVKFLIEEKSVQDYADKDEYSERRVSVIRGRLVTSQGLGIAGVRVSVNRDTRFGLTLSRKNGWFDIMVNGGGAVNLQFQRAPFRPMTRPVAVAWNQLVVLDPIVMLQDTERPAADASTPPPACHTHQPDLLRPVIINTWQPDTVIDADETGDVDGAAVLVETQTQTGTHAAICGHAWSEQYRAYGSGAAAVTVDLARAPRHWGARRADTDADDYKTVQQEDFKTWSDVFRIAGQGRQAFRGCAGAHPQRPPRAVLQESIEIPGTGLRLVYNSQDASGYHSTLLMRLTADPVPETLVLVHLKVIVEGTVFTQTFESDPNITYSYSWNKRNVYEQKVYGMAQAHVSVGYEYSDCAAIVWDTRVLPIPGFRMDISDIGGWNLDIHHMYNFHEGMETFDENR
ncbi:Teneurin-a [Amphibalanus amphitrite]|uniref:Teneurin-a n=1 Tax=Amphibalanus amphitrite TaxID=1232801 RepID=A0A6A4WJU9_AMPAM|nr:Teneurin-a [Amphibalanus amphitrite]